MCLIQLHLQKIQSLVTLVDTEIRCSREKEKQKSNKSKNLSFGGANFTVCSVTFLLLKISYILGGLCKMHSRISLDLNKCQRKYFYC